MKKSETKEVGGAKDTVIDAFQTTFRPIEKICKGTACQLCFRISNYYPGQDLNPGPSGLTAESIVASSSAKEAKN